MPTLTQTLILQKRSQRRAKAPAGSRIAFGLVLIFASLVAALAAAAGLAYRSALNDLPDVSLVAALLHPTDGALLQPTRLYDRTGAKLIASLENPGIPRRYLSADPTLPEHIDPLLAQAYVGLHDPAFWQSEPIRWQAGLSPQPSGLAEELAQSLLLASETPNWRHAVRLRALGAQLIERYGYAQVLEWTLNSASFGHLAYGADSAARLYLGKPATALGLNEAVLLAAVAESPALNPLNAPVAARELIPPALDRLRAAGQITAAEAETAASAALAFSEPPAESSEPARAFSRMVIDRLASRFDRAWLERGGLTIRTTLDLDLQNQLNCALPGASASCPQASQLPEEINASAVVLDVNSGEVLALSGDRTNAGEQDNLLPHPPGSLLTPFVALTGFARGMSPASLLWDVPASQESAPDAYPNPDGSYHGPVRLRMALANDYLVPLARLAEQLGADTIQQTSTALGLNPQSSPAEALFAGEPASPLDLAQAYAVFAALGLRSGERAIDGSLEAVMALDVVDSAGKNWLQVETATDVVLSQPLAYLAHHILSDETARWPSLGYPNDLEIGRPAGAKLGQTAGGRDAWAAGYTRQRAVVVWLGSESTINLALAAQTWQNIILAASQNQPAESWSQPPGISVLQVCDPSGLLPTTACPAVVSERFATGSEPNTYDDLYRDVAINRETGLLATVFTPPELVENRTYLIVPAEAENWARLTGLPVPPKEYDVIQLPAANSSTAITQPAIFSAVRGQVRIFGSAAGDDFASYRLQVGEGLNPQTWLQVGDESTQPVRSDLLGEWDTTGMDGLYALRLLVVNNDHTLQSALIQVTVDNTAPLARITYPLEGDRLAPAAGANLTFQADVQDAVGMREVSWWLDGKQIATARQAPYRLIWTPQPGQHTLQVIVVDQAGNSAESPTVRFSVEKQ